MRSIGILLLISNWTWAISVPVKADTNELQYLIEPPVYAEVTGRRGDNVTLPCLLRNKPKHYKVKWTKLEPEPAGIQNIVMILNAHAYKPYGHLGQRAYPRNAHAMDVSLQLSHLQLDDGGGYRCELINGIEDENVVITLRIEAWTEGLDWCNAGWLHDGTVDYPIIEPRAACGGGLLPGIRSYGPKDKDHDHFDAFCFTSLASGSVFYVRGTFSFSQAELACKQEGAELALVGQLYSAWHFLHYDQCDPGWLKDGSVRFPISNPRRRCGGVSEAGVRSFGFPDKRTHLYGAYCYR